MTKVTIMKVTMMEGTLKEVYNGGSCNGRWKNNDEDYTYES